MEKRVLEKSTRDDLECELMDRIKEMNLHDIYIKLNSFNAIANLLADPIAQPISGNEARENRKLLDDTYPNRTFKTRFTINNLAINKIIGENWSRKYLHIFFINDNNINNELALVFRFSRMEDINDNNLNIIDFKKESAYWLLNDGNVLPFDNNSEKFSVLKDRFKIGVGMEIQKPNNAELTHYITYDVAKILSFNGFEQDITFEVMCVQKYGKIKMGLQTYIVDNDRVHHNDENGDPVYEGYYDLGNLKP